MISVAFELLLNEMKNVLMRMFSNVCENLADSSLSQVVAASRDIREPDLFVPDCIALFPNATVFACLCMYILTIFVGFRVKFRALAMPR